MEWPSANIPHGGILHPAKVTSYSPDTQKYLKLLMDESHMNNRLRDKVNYTLRNGEPLPKFKSDTPSYYRRRIPHPPVLIQQGGYGKRTRDAIMKSGAYEPEPFVPDFSKEDREQAKARFQDIMSKGKANVKIPKFKPKCKPETPKITNKFDQIMEEIQERQDWLDDMEKLGEAHKYRDIINMQIDAKLRELELMKVVQTPKTERGDGDKKKKK